MYSDLRENWQYNEWPDVDLEGNIITKKSRSNLRESVGSVCPECGSNLAHDGTCPRCRDEEAYYNEALEDDELEELFNVNVPINASVDGGTGNDVSVLSTAGLPGLGESKEDDDNEEVLKECGETVEEDTSIKKCDKCGKILPANDLTAKCKNMKLQEAADDAEEVEEDPVEDEEVADLKGQVRNALDSLTPPEGEDELDQFAVIDAVLAYFDNDDALEYIRSCICPDEEDVEIEEEKIDESLNESAVDQDTYAIDGYSVIARWWTDEDGLRFVRARYENADGLQVYVEIPDGDKNYPVTVLKSNDQIRLEDNSAFSNFETFKDELINISK